MKLIRRIIIIILIVLIAVVAFFIYNGKQMYKSSIDKTPLDKKVAEIRNNKDFVRLDEVPEYYINAVIAVEDHRYKEHGAVDLIGICRAIVSNAKAKEFNEGGSTVTQQVAKNLYYIGEGNYIYRKIAECFIAFDLENHYSKDEILELYMNIIYFGDGYYGISQAAKGYYNKEPKDLTLYEATMLAGVPNAPSVYAPTVNPDLAKSRQNKVLSDMVEYGFLSQEEADKIMN